MTSIKIKLGKRNAAHQHLTVFDGPDMEHLAKCGDLCMTPGGAKILVDSLRQLANSCFDENDVSQYFVVEDESNIET